MDGVMTEADLSAQFVAAVRAEKTAATRAQAAAGQYRQMVALLRALPDEFGAAYTAPLAQRLDKYRGEAIDIDRILKIATEHQAAETELRRIQQMKAKLERAVAED